MLIRDEAAGDGPAISLLVTEAFLLLAQSTGTEAGIVERLRADDALAVSIVAEDDGLIVGYLAVSAASVGAEDGWRLFGPLAVLPSRHRQGIGRAMMAEAIGRLQTNSRGAVLVGDPDYYGRFGFRTFPSLRLSGVPPEVVQALPFDCTEPRGELIHHPAFGLKQAD